MAAILSRPQCVNEIFWLIKYKLPHLCGVRDINYCPFIVKCVFHDNVGLETKSDEQIWLIEIK